MKNMVSLTIDGKQVTVPEGTLIVNAAKQIGIDIPVFCYHPKMEPVGMCRQCLVEVGRPVIDRASGNAVLEADGSPKIQFGSKLETACSTPVSEGMVVIGSSPKAAAGRKDILEFLLTSHPLDCPICDKGGECPLQNLTMRYGPGESRFSYAEKMHLAKKLPLGELIYLDRERCIQCGRCVRFQSIIADDPVIAFTDRGRGMEIFSCSEPGFDSYFSGNTTDICPVGALTTADFRFEARPWELCTTASICPHCPVGCNLAINLRREARSGGEVVIKRIMPRQNESVNEIWICDKGRFAYHYAESKERLTQPLVRREGELVNIGWDEALSYVAENFKDAGKNLLTLASGRLSNEDLFSLSEFTSGLDGKTALYTHMAGGDLVAQLGVGKGTNLSELGAGTVILVVASDLEEEAPIWFLRVKQAAERGATLIVANPRSTKLERYAKEVVHYPYGSEAATVLAMINSMSAKQNFPKAPKLNLGGEAVKAAAETISAAQNLIIFYGSEGIGLEASQALAQACANLLMVTNHARKVNNGLIAVWSRANDQGAWELGFRPLPNLKEAFKEYEAIYIAAADPAGDEPALVDAIRNAGFVVVQDLFLTETAKLADVVLPAQPFTEREGTYTSGERRVQRFYPGVVRNEFRADYAITAAISKLVGINVEASPMRIFNHLVAKVPAFKDLSYRLLAQVTEQWPIVGRGEIYYGGTLYANAQGLGVQLSHPSQMPSLAWPQVPEITQPEGQLLAVPITILYDRGQTVMPSDLLYHRIPHPYIAVHPDEATRINMMDGSRVYIELDGISCEVLLRLNEQVPPGIALVPRSLGVPIYSPVPVEISVAETGKM
ncbi:MAG: NADH dehydrogenase (quinone) subunit G [Chloroflexi bacterium RBG_13_50_21]|nr:MAG: NADH dehydrogenase (quinone) subunit G [Chloroflexi bacterium RBG_13_50_21]